MTSSDDEDFKNNRPLEGKNPGLLQDDVSDEDRSPNPGEHTEPDANPTISQQELPEEESVMTSQKETSTNQWRMTFYISAAIIGFYLFSLAVMVNFIEVEDQKWNRLLFILAGIEAIAFSAAGFLFGSSVERRNTLTAEQQRNEAQQEVAKVRESASASLALLTSGPARETAFAAQDEAIAELRRIVSR